MFQEFLFSVLILLMMEGVQSQSKNRFCSEDCEYYKSRSMREYEACVLVQERRSIGECGLSLFLIIFMIVVGVVLLGVAIWFCCKCRKSLQKENGSVVQWLNS